MELVLVRPIEDYPVGTRIIVSHNTPGLGVDGFFNKECYICFNTPDGRFHTHQANNVSRYYLCNNWFEYPHIFEADDVREPTVYRHPTLTGENVNAPPPTLILDEYFALFADGRIRGPFPNRNGVREAYGRVRRYQRRRIYSDGNINTTDHTFR